MADNLTTQTTVATPPDGTVIGAYQGTLSGDSAYVGVGLLATSSGAEGSRTFTVIDPATSGKQDTGNTSLASIDTKTPALVSGRQPVDGSGVTQPVSAASLPLPTGAATLAKQPALGTAGAASADVISIQGIASMTAVKVDGSAVTQPVSIAATVTTTETVPTTIYNGKKTVTTAGTRVTLASSQAIKSVTIKALAANTGTIYVGDGSVSSTTGFQLAAGDSISMDIANLATVNLDASVSGEGVSYLAVG